MIHDFLQYIKTNEIDKANQLLNKKINEMNREKLLGIRVSIDEINQTIVQIKIQLKKIDIHEQLIKQTVPTAMLKSVDIYRQKLKEKHASLEIKKRRLLR